MSWRQLARCKRARQSMNIQLLGGVEVEKGAKEEVAEEGMERRGKEGRGRS